MDEALVATRLSLHGIAELVMAGPQHRRGAGIRLRVTPGGFGTVAEPAARVDGTELVSGGTRVAIAGRTLGELAQAVGVQASPLDDVWPEHFDIAIDGDEVNYGVSPGDDFLAEPYTYVGPRKLEPSELWNAPFGAVRPLPELGGSAGVLAFFNGIRSRM